METRVNKIATAVGAALLGMALAQPATSQQRDPAAGSPGVVQTQPGGASPAHTSCDGLQGIQRENCLARQSSPSVTEQGGSSAGSTVAPRTERDMPRDSASSGTSERRGIRGFFSRNRDTAATASAGSTMAREGRAAEPPFQGSNPANQFCDQQIGRARADCLEYNSSGNAIQEGWGG